MLSSFFCAYYFDAITRVRDWKGGVQRQYAGPEQSEALQSPPPLFFCGGTLKLILYFCCNE
jgi:hypothetical protein